VGSIGTMDRISLAAREGQRTRSHRIIGRTTRINWWQARVIMQNLADRDSGGMVLTIALLVSVTSKGSLILVRRPLFFGRRPGWIDVLAVDLGPTLPLLAGPAYANRVADRPTLVDDVVELALFGAHDDGAWPLGTLVRHELACQLGGCARLARLRRSRAGLGPP
jgi:hypothetical protein